MSMNRGCSWSMVVGPRSKTGGWPQARAWSQWHHRQAAKLRSMVVGPRSQVQGRMLNVGDNQRYGSSPFCLANRWNPGAMSKVQGLRLQVGGAHGALRSRREVEGGPEAPGTRSFGAHKRAHGPAGRKRGLLSLTRNAGLGLLLLREGPEAETGGGEMRG